MFGESRIKQMDPFPLEIVNFFHDMVETLYFINYETYN
jgi:hypothetical protein